MVNQVDLKKIRPIPEVRRQTPVCIRWLRRPAGMVVGEDEGKRIPNDDRAEDLDFPWMRSALAQGSQRYEVVSFRAIFGVE